MVVVVVAELCWILCYHAAEEDSPQGGLWGKKQEIMLPCPLSIKEQNGKEKWFTV